MTVPTTRPGRPGAAPVRSPAADAAYRRAWWSLALYPLSFGVALALGEGILALLTDDPEAAPLWQVVLAATPALLVLVLPGVLAVVLGRRAMRLGRRAGRVPAVVGGAVGVGVVLLNVVAYVVGG